MKKKIIIPVIILISLALVLFLPIPQGSYDDGGTRDYNALTYKIVRWNKIIVDLDENGQPMPQNTYRKTSVFWYPDNQKSIDELWQIEIADKKADVSNPYFTGKVLEKYEIGCLLEVTNNGNQPLILGDMIVVNTDIENCPEYTKGDFLTITFDGNIAESYPMQIFNVSTITKTDALGKSIE